MYCKSCGSLLSQDARFCQSCGIPQNTAQPPSPPPMTSAPVARNLQPQQKPKSKTLWLVIGVILLCVIIIGILSKSPSDKSAGDAGEGKTSSSSTTAQTVKEAQFNALKPSEHLSQAMAALKPGATPDQIEEGLHHSQAIPESAPEHARATSVATKLIRAQHLAEAKTLIETAPVDDLKGNLDNLRRANDEIQAVLQQNLHDKDALKLLTLATNKGREALGGSQQTREAFAQNLQQRLTSMGYDINVWVHGEASDTGRELNFDSEMFKDTATRVQFINGVLPEWKKNLCKVGFREVKLRQGGTFELGQDYSLRCQN